MRKITYFAAVVLVALVFTGAGCAKKTPAQQTGGGANVAASNGPEVVNSSIKELVAQGKPYKCTYTVTVEGVAQNGTLYVADKKIRGDVTMKIPQLGTNTVSHFIMDGTTQYMWTDGQPKGWKMTISEEQAKQAAATGSQQNVDMDVKMDMKCAGWSPEASIFERPSNIQFDDLNAMMNSLKGPAGGSGSGGTQGTIDMCSICNQVPAGAARDSCKKSNCK